MAALGATCEETGGFGRSSLQRLRRRGPIQGFGSAGKSPGIPTGGGGL